MNKTKVTVREGQAPGKLARDHFCERFFDKFKDPAFSIEKSALERIEVIAWDSSRMLQSIRSTEP